MANEETRPASTPELIEKGFQTVSSHTETPTGQTISEFMNGLDSTSTVTDSSASTSSDDS